MSTPAASSPLAAATDRHRAEEAVATVAERLEDPDRVAAVAGRDDNRDPIYGQVMWSPVTLSNGWPGVALFYGELARQDARWLSTAHAHLSRAGETMRSTPHRGMFAGPAAVLTAAHAAAGEAGHYAGLRAKLADWLATLVLTQLDHERRRERTGVDWFSYDLINGISGSARVLLASAEDPVESGPRVQRALAAALDRLVRLAEPITALNHRVPGWWVPPEAQPTDRDRLDHPEGDFNVGLAHGVPGPLAVLSHAVHAGHEVAGQRVAIERMAEWLLRWKHTDEAGSYWPCRVSFADEVAGPDTMVRPATRTAWCYGSPGVAAGLHAAGTALDRPSWTAESVAALRAALVRDEAEWAVDGPTICHGYAGLLAICNRIGVSTGDAALLDGTRRLVRSVLELADEQAAFVFPHLMRYPRGANTDGRTHKAVDVAGLLEGAAGVAAALHTAVQPETREGGAPVWQRCLGIR